MDLPRTVTEKERVPFLHEMFSKAPALQVGVVEKKFLDGPQMCMEGFRNEGELRLPLGLGQLIRSLIGWKVEGVDWISNGELGFYRVYVTK